jgi:spermidine synthase
MRPVSAPFIRALLFASLLLPALARAEPVVLYEKRSAYSTIIVSEEAGVRTLRFERGGARQTVAKPDDPTFLALPYARVALLGLALVPEPRRILVLGLGGGTLPRFMHRYYPDTVIDAVDIDPEVVHVAREFFGFRDSRTLRAHVADGRRFIEETREPYDVIFLDAFGTRSVPPHLTTHEFLQAVRRALKPEGVVIGNVWSGEFNPLYGAMVRTYYDAFETVRVVPVTGAGNRMVIALPRAGALTTERLAKLGSALSSRKGFQFDLGTWTADEVPQEQEAIRAASVLRDAPAR